MHSDDKLDEGVRPGCALLLYGDDMVPEDVSRSLGVTADRTCRAGEKVSSTHPMSAVYKTSHWGLYSWDHVNSTDPSDHLNWLKNAIAPVLVRDLPTVEVAVIAVFFCTEHECDQIRLPADFVDFVAQCGACLDFAVDYWPPDSPEEAKQKD